jgi:hypothetical protein
MRPRAISGAGADRRHAATDAGAAGDVNDDAFAGFLLDEEWLEAA